MYIAAAVKSKRTVSDSMNWTAGGIPGCEGVGFEGAAAARASQRFGFTRKMIAISEHRSQERGLMPL
jgi:hypothetical protein